MIKKIKMFLAKKIQNKKQKAQSLKMKKYYEIVQAGASFLKYIHEDLDRQKKSMNRSQRRKWEVSLKHKGEFNAEMIQTYANHIDKVLAKINKSLEKK